MTKITVTESLANGLRNRFFEEMAGTIAEIADSLLSNTRYKANREGFNKSYAEIKRRFKEIFLLSYEGGSNKKPYVAFQLLTVSEGKEYNTWNERCLTGITYLANFDPRFVDDNVAVFNISEHAIARLYLRTEPKLVNNVIDYRYIIDEMFMLPFWSNYWAMTLYTGMDSDDNDGFDFRGYVFPVMPAASGLFFSEFTEKSKYIEVRTFVDDDQLTFEQSEVKTMLMEVAKDAVASPICFFLSVASSALDDLMFIHQVITNRLITHKSYPYLRNAFFHKVEDDRKRVMYKLEFDKLMKSYINFPYLTELDQALTSLGARQFQLLIKKSLRRDYTGIARGNL
jgi:hypothetical protein